MIIILPYDVSSPEGPSSGALNYNVPDEDLSGAETSYNKIIIIKF